MCKDDDQWNHYIDLMQELTADSLLTNIEMRGDNGFILRGEGSCYMKVTPTDKRALTLRWFCEKIWLCDENLFNGERNNDI